MRIFEIIAKYQQLFDKDELTFEDESQLSEYKENIQEFAIQTAAYIKNMEAEFEQVDKAMLSMGERLDDLAERIDKKKAFLLKLLADNHIDAIKDSPHFVIKVQKGREKVDDFDQTVIPQDYWKRKEVYNLDKELIKFDIKRGIIVPGARLMKQDKVTIK